METTNLEIVEFPASVKARLGAQFLMVGLAIGAGAGALGYRHFAKAETPKEKAAMYPRFFDREKDFRTRPQEAENDFPEHMPPAAD